jgi:hypothetical protein
VQEAAGKVHHNILGRVGPVQPVTITANVVGSEGRAAITLCVCGEPGCSHVVPAVSAWGMPGRHANDWCHHTVNTAGISLTSIASLSSALIDLAAGAWLMRLPWRFWGPGVSATVLTSSWHSRLRGRARPLHPA